MAKENPITIDIIKKLLKQRYEGFQKDPKTIISEFNRTQETKDSYNGRSILEMLQNADDAKAKLLKIEINITQIGKLICFTNDGGHPFSEGGFESLLRPDFSPKKGSDEIGQKGLGFRSLLNLSKSITICSNEVEWHYSEGNIDCFISKIEEIEANNKGDTSFASWKKENPEFKNQIPIFLAPIYSKYEITQEWTTRIELEVSNDMKNEIAQIHKEIEELNGNILLFLKSVEKIEIFEESKLIKSLYKKKLKNGNCTIVTDSADVINELEWKISKQSLLFPTDIEQDPALRNTEIGVAYLVNHELAKNERMLYAYLPTTVCLSLPLIAHARFSLTSDRNSLNNDIAGKNKFLIEHLTSFIVKIAIERTANECNWEPYKMLFHSDENQTERLAELGLYNKLKEHIQTEKIYPCVDEEYKAKKEFVNYGNRFSNFILDNKLSKFYPEQIKPYESPISISACNKNEDSLFVFKINELASSIVEPKQIAKLIYILHSNELKNIPKAQANKENKNNGDKNEEYFYSILRDSDNKIITPTNDFKIFTPKPKTGAQIVIPSYMHSYVSFINDDINAELLDLFNIRGKDPNRELVKPIRELFGENVFEYDKANMPDIIVSVANDLIRKSNSDVEKVSILDEMYLALYEFHLDKINIKNIPALTKSRKIVEQISNLFIPETFPNAKHEREIFTDFRNADDYVDFPTDWKIWEERDADCLGRFLKLLGANEYVKIEFVKRNTNITSDDYGEFLKNEIGWRENLKAGSEGLSDIKDRDSIVAHLSPEQFVFLCLKSKAIKELLNNDNKKDVIHLRGLKDGAKGDVDIPHTSFLKYMLRKEGKFKDFIYHTIYKEFNDLKFNENDKLFEGINKREIESILLNLGAVERISDLSAEKISKIIKDLPQTNPTGKRVQGIYLDAVKAYASHRTTLANTPELKLWSQSKKYIEKENTFVTNALIPKSLANGIHLLDFPQRQGKKEDILEYFAIKELGQKGLKLIDPELNAYGNNKFAEKIDSIKPFMLAYRLTDDGLNMNTKRDAARTIKQIEFKFIQVGSAYTLNKREYLMQDGDVIFDSEKKCFYWAMQKDKEPTQEQLAEVLFEAYSASFDLSKNNDTAAFEKFISGKKDWILKNFGESLLEEAYSLLDQSYGVDIQARNFVLSKISNAEDKAFFEDQLKSCHKREREGIDRIISIMRSHNIEISKFNTVAEKRLNLKSYHQNKFNDLFEKNKSSATHLLWKQAENNESLQSKLVVNINRYTGLLTEFGNIELQDSLTVNYSSEFNRLFEAKFKMKFAYVPESKNIDDIFKENLKQSEGIDKENLSDEDKGLLFFHPINRTPLATKHNSLEVHPPEEFNLVEVSSVAVAPPKKNTSQQKFGNGWHRTKQTQNKGADSEEIAFDAYKKKYPNGNVTRVSSNSPTGVDGLGYDLTYCENDLVHYVEIKSFDSDHVYFSQQELSIAKRLDHYEIALVNRGDRTIKVMRNLFKYNEGESFSKNSRFNAIEEITWILYLKPSDK